MYSRPATPTAARFSKAAPPRSSERKLIRRYLSVAEFGKLRTAAEKARQFQKVKGRDRSVAYLVAATTGLRRDEIGSLVPESFDFAARPATVTVLGSFTKNRQTAVIPLRGDVAAEIKEWLVDKKPGKPILPISNIRTADMIRFDMKRAGIQNADSQGRVVDFHALRVTFGSHLAKSGVDLSTAQKLMRHSTPVLTANIYQVAGINDLGEAVERMPPFGRPKPQSGGRKRGRKRAG